MYDRPNSEVSAARAPECARSVSDLMTHVGSDDCLERVEGGGDLP